MLSRPARHAQLNEIGGIQQNAMSRSRLSCVAQSSGKCSRQSMMTVQLRGLPLVGSSPVSPIFNVGALGLLPRDMPHAVRLAA